MPTSAQQGESIPLQELVPRRTDRALLVGQTGSGKTTLARYLLTKRRYKVIADYKGKITWPEYRLCKSLRELFNAKEDALLYRPDYRESQDEEAHSRFFEWIYLRGGTTVYVDETAAITKGQIYPYHYGACLMRGRELGIELWSATQRPAFIPSVVLSESEHVYAFYLKMEQDRKRVESMTGIREEEIAALAKMNFLYGRQDGGVVGPLHLLLP